jgi:hypothetical protein
MQLSTVFIQLLNGVQYGMLLFLIASGLTLTFGVMGIINLAHGAFFMIGAGRCPQPMLQPCWRSCCSVLVSNERSWLPLPIATTLTRCL